MASSSTPNNLDSNESSLQSAGDSNKDNDKDGTLMEAREQETQKIANEIKQHIKEETSMRALCQKAIEDAKTATRDNVVDKDMVITLVTDYCGNMEMPFFGKDQPGETYYYTPKTVNLFGIVDYNPVKELLHAYGYGEEHGGNKGSNNDALLLKKHLEDHGLLDGTKRKSMNVMMDNCTGQNKNNYILRLAPSLI
jgi:hypothetical protein